MYFPHTYSLTRFRFWAVVLGLSAGITSPALAATLATSNILYLNSTRGSGTGVLGNYRSAIANSLDDYGDGTIFDVDFVQTHAAGDLAFWLNSQSVSYYDQIWFDTTIFQTALLDSTDLTALNTWAANEQPEFILDSTFFFRNRTTPKISNSAAALTVNQALALRDAGGGIFIGTDNDNFSQTANQVLTNFGFDELFRGISAPLTANASFTDNLLLAPETVGTDLFVNHLQELTTSSVPMGVHELNENGDNRTIQIYEHLRSVDSDDEEIGTIGASFKTRFVQPVPEQNSILGILMLGAIGVASIARFRKE
ncbi:MAG: hypothetical protein SW833_22535 [Cyanobacteriota bacterium]|nr:hypothetical protein [Cyanobacteriota bacterium]